MYQTMYGTFLMQRDHFPSRQRFCFGCTLQHPVDGVCFICAPLSFTISRSSVLAHYCVHGWCYRKHVSLIKSEFLLIFTMFFFLFSLLSIVLHFFISFFFSFFFFISSFFFFRAINYLLKLFMHSEVQLHIIRYTFSTFVSTNFVPVRIYFHRLRFRFSFHGEHCFFFSIFL